MCSSLGPKWYKDYAVIFYIIPIFYIECILLFYLAIPPINLKLDNPAHPQVMDKLYGVGVQFSFEIIFVVFDF